MEHGLLDAPCNSVQFFKSVVQQRCGFGLASDCPFFPRFCFCTNKQITWLLSFSSLFLFPLSISQIIHTCPKATSHKLLENFSLSLSLSLSLSISIFFFFGMKLLKNENFHWIITKLQNVGPKMNTFQSLWLWTTNDTSISLFLFR